MYKLLIVDDEEIERRAIEYVIRNTELKISEIAQAPNGKEAVAAASVFEPDIILMDINMPGLNGIKSTEVIRKFMPDTHVVFLTAFDEFDYAKQAVKLGVDDFVVKPATPEMLEKTLGNVIDEIEKKKANDKKAISTKEKLEDTSDYIKECLVEALVLGETDKQKIIKLCTFANMDYFEYGFGAIIDAQLEYNQSLSDMNIASKRKMVFDRLSRKIKKEIYDCILYVKNNCLYCFGYNADYKRIVDNQARLQLLVEKMTSQSLVGLGVSVKLAIGPICQDMDKLWTSFSKAKEIFKGSNSDPYIKDIKEIVNLFNDCILEGDKDCIAELVEKAQNILVKEALSIENYRSMLLEFEIELKRALENKMKSNLDFNDSLYLMASKAESYEDGKQFLIYFTDKLYNICSIESNDKNAIIVNRLKSYIEDNIRDNITLEQLAEMSNMSSFYISKLFKKYLTLNFSDYLTFVRISNSKKLLKETLLTVKQISYNVGYSDPNYFTRVFKKETGISPTRYRSETID